MRKLISTFIIALMAFGMFGMITMQPIQMQAGAVKQEEKKEEGLFKDFDVEYKEGNVTIGNKKDSESSWTTLIDKYKQFIIGVSGMAAVTMVAAFIMNFTKIGLAGDNPTARKAAMTGSLFTGIAAAALGAVSLITGIFYGFFD